MHPIRCLEEVTQDCQLDHLRVAMHICKQSSPLGRPGNIRFVSSKYGVGLTGGYLQVPDNRRMLFWLLASSVGGGKLSDL